MRTRIILLTGLAAIVTAFVSAIPTSAQQAAADAPTFTKDVAPVLFKNCVTCHRPGEAGADVPADLRTGAARRQGDRQCGGEPHDASVARRRSPRHVP